MINDDLELACSSSGSEMKPDTPFASPTFKPESTGPAAPPFGDSCAMRKNECGLSAGLSGCCAEFAFDLSSNPGIGHLDAAPQRPLSAPPQRLDSCIAEISGSHANWSVNMVDLNGFAGYACHSVNQIIDSHILRIADVNWAVEV